MKFKILTVLSLLLAPLVFAVGSVEEALAPLRKPPLSLQVTSTQVDGSAPIPMLKSYALKQGYDEQDLILKARLPKSEFPESEDGSAILGFVKIVDVVEFAYDPMKGLDESEDKKRRKITMDALFEARKRGGLVGLESTGGFRPCGIQIPGVFVLDPEQKKVFSINVKNGDC